MEEASRQTALHLSVQHMAVTAIHILASHGACVNAIDSGGMTPLHMAAGLLHKDIIASLIKEGADLNMVCVVLLSLFFEYLDFFSSINFYYKIKKIEIQKSLIQ